jgi:hypothetical protein
MNEREMASPEMIDDNDLNDDNSVVASLDLQATEAAFNDEKETVTGDIDVPKFDVDQKNIEMNTSEGDDTFRKTICKSNSAEVDSCANNLIFDEVHPVLLEKDIAEIEVLDTTVPKQKNKQKSPSPEPQKHAQSIAKELANPVKKTAKKKAAKAPAPKKVKQLVINVSKSEVNESVGELKDMDEDELVATIPKKRSIKKATSTILNPEQSGIHTNVKRQRKTSDNSLDLPIITEPRSSTKSRKRGSKIDYIDSPIRILFTGINMEDPRKKICTQLGAVEVDDWQQCTHLVTDRIRRNIKFLCCVSAGKHIMDIGWLEASKKLKRFAGEYSLYR